ncbi:cysteine hydrolase [Micrococcus porci]|uniref:cysteine hydrolase family protein n=1 Tax=Micrococcus porci TaxID=2856555 RepID=UPI001CCF8FC1|nr:cysteine hydrolase family protein [Micrococcus porci]UBH25224.1 cysteine hydrolase [Micrococcus porci]
MNTLQNPALIVVDVQRGFDDVEYWGSRDNPDCETNISSLLTHWRDRSWPIVFVRHDSTNPESTLAVGTPGNEFKEVITGDPDLLVSKTVNSSFHGTPDLDDWLRAEGIEQVVICGITTNHCCETTARIAGNLGYDTYFAIDATHTFDRPALDGTVLPAATVSAMTAANLHGEFATVVSTRTLIDGNSYAPRYEQEK